MMPPAYRCLRACVALLAVGCSVIAHPVSAQVQLGAHTMLKIGEGDGVNPAVTSPIATRTSGSSLVVFNGGYTNNLTTPTDTYQNSWTQLGDPVIYTPYGGSFAATGYVSILARGGANHTVTIVKNSEPAGEITIPFIEIENAGVLQDVAQNYPESGTTLTSGSVTTTGPATLVALWWGDGSGTMHSAVPNNGFAVIDSFLLLPDNSGVQCAVAVKQVVAAGTYDVTWTDDPDQGAILWLLAFQSGQGLIFANGFD